MDARINRSKDEWMGNNDAWIEGGIMNGWSNESLDGGILCVYVFVFSSGFS